LTSNDLEGLINRLYTPDTRASDRYNDLLDAPPQMNKPGIMRALLAGTAAFGANAKGKDMLDIQDRVMYSPYAKAKEEWTTKTTPFGQAATNEVARNNTERTLATNTATNMVNLDRNRATEEDRVEKNRIAELRATAYAFKQRNPNWVIDERGERIIATNPQTLETRDLGPSFGMTERDKIELQNEGRIQAAAASVGNMLQSPDGTVWERDAKTGEWRPAKGGPTVAPTTPQPAPQPREESGVNLPNPQSNTPKVGDRVATELATERNEKARELYKLNPRWANLFNVQGDKYSLRKRPVYGWTTTDAQDEPAMAAWDRMAKEIDPSYIAPPMRSGGVPSDSSPSAPVQSQPAPPLQKPQAPPTIGDFQQPGTGPTRGLAPSVSVSLSPDGRITGGQVSTPSTTVRPGEVVIRDKQGNTFAIPAENLQKALATGEYQQVR
jgi:hypothetical protein